MRILILEDSPERIKVYKHIYVGVEMDVTDDPKQANQWISEREYDIISLDHDLLDEHYKVETNCNETTGLCTAEFLGNNPELCKDAQVVIHSWNPIGSERMMAACKNRNPKRLPFSTNMKVIIDQIR